MRIGKFFLFLLFTGPLHAQQWVPGNFARYTSSEGLSGNHITALAQDSAGYLWITTYSGFNRFNGRSFEQFHSAADSNSANSDFSAGLNWLNRDLLGIYNSGLHIVNTKTGRRYNVLIPYQRQYQYKFNMVERAAGDAEGNLFILTRSGFYQFNKAGKLLFRFDRYRGEEVPFAHFYFGRELIRLDETRWLIVAVDGLYLFNKKTQSLRKMRPDDDPLLAEYLDYVEKPYMFFPYRPGAFFVLDMDQNNITFIDIRRRKKTKTPISEGFLKKEVRWRSRLFVVSDSMMYLTAQGSGFYPLHLQKSTGRVMLDERKCFESYQCNTLFTDRDGYLWIGTSAGLFRQDQNKTQVQKMTLPEVLVRAHPNMSFGEVYANKDKIFLGTRDPGHLVVYDKKSLQYRYHINLIELGKNPARSFNVYAIAPAGNDHIMLSTNGWPLLLNTRTRELSRISLPGWNFINDWSPDAYSDHRGIVWISASMVYQYESPARVSFIPRDQQQATGIIVPEVMGEDGEGHIWMAGHGVARYNTHLKQFDIRLDTFPSVTMPDKQVSTLVVDKVRQTVWFNSANNGLIGYHIPGRKYYHYTTANRLPSNDVLALCIAGNKLWIGGTRGLACLDLRTHAIQGFAREDGLPEMPVAGRSNFFYDSTEQLLYACFEKAVVRFDPYKILTAKKAPSLFIEAIHVNGSGSSYLPLLPVQTSWKQNEFRIDIGTINFSDPEHQRYAYRIIKDENTPWTDLGTQSGFAISNLAPRRHRVQVKVYSANNRWPEQVKEFSIDITPPFWKRNWFYVLMGCLFVLLVWGLIRWRSSVARRKEMVKTLMEKIKADEYKAQYELEQVSNFFSSSLSDKKTEDEVLWNIARDLIGKLGYEDCIIYMWNEKKTRMVQKAAYGPKGSPEEIQNQVFEVEPGQGIVGQVIIDRNPILVTDTRQDPRYRVDDQFRFSEVAVPIIHGGELLGVIDSEHSQAGYFSERDIKILTTIATLVGNKLVQLQSERHLEAKQKELMGINEQLAEARLSALQAQMNPHFVFNALNSIKRMILDSDNHRASRYLSKFALMIRMTLEHSKETFVTLDENVEYLKAYLDMEKLRFDDTFSYSIFISDHIDTSETALPSMMIQPIVENAIWHGLMQAEKDKKIRIAFTQTGHRLACMVEDNGIGFRRSKELAHKQRPLHQSVGLENLQKRIRIMNEKYKTDCHLQIIDLTDAGEQGGTRVILEMNLIQV